MLGAVAMNTTEAYLELVQIFRFFYISSLPQHRMFGPQLRLFHVWPKEVLCLQRGVFRGRRRK